MRRRDFIGAVGLSATLPLASRAQQTTTPRVGYVWLGDKGTDAASGAGLRQGLADRGYVIGQNLIFEERYAQGKAENVPALVGELLALQVNVLVTVGGPGQPCGSPRHLHRADRVRVG